MGTTVMYLKTVDQHAAAIDYVVATQKAGGVVAWIDTHHDFNINAARVAGVNIHDLLISQPDSKQQAEEIISVLANCGAVDVVIISQQLQGA